MASEVKDETIEAQLRRVVIKDSNERLIDEMKCAQNVFDDVAVNNMSRNELLTYVCMLRALAGQTHAVRHIVSGFDPSQAEFSASAIDQDDDFALSDVSADVKESDFNVFQSMPAVPMDTTALLASMIQIMQSQMIAATDRENREKSEKMKWENQQREERIEKERKETEEREERQRRDAAGAQERNIILESLRLAQIQADKRLELEQQRAERIETRAEAESSRRDVRLQKAVNVMKGILYHMPYDVTGILLYFKNVDDLFLQNNIDNDLKISLLNPYLTEKARRVVMNLPPGDRDSYEHWKQAILREHRLTPKLYRQSFDNAIRTSNESCIQFATRLCTLQDFYFQSRNLDNSYNALVQLLLSDRLKDTLTPEARCFISDREGNDWFDVHRVAELIDMYESERGQSKRRYQQNYDRIGPTLYNSLRDANTTVNSGIGEPIIAQRSFNSDWKRRIRCTVCNRTGHLSKDHWFSNNQRNKPKENLAKGNQNRCFHCLSPNHLARHCPERMHQSKTYHTQRINSFRSQPDTDFNSNSGELQAAHRVTTPKSVNKVVRPANVLTSAHCSLNSPNVPCINNAFFTDFGSGPVKCILDSGAEISVLKPSMLAKNCIESDSAQTTIKIQGVWRSD